MKSKLTRKISRTDKITVKGILSDDCKTVTYEDEDGLEQTITVDDLLTPMASQMIDFAVTLKSEEDAAIPEIE